MKLENQYATIDQCKRLKELGIIQEGQFSWVYSNSESNHELYFNKVVAIDLLAQANLDNKLWQRIINEGIFSAWSVAELGELLPDKFQYQLSECFVDSVKFCKEHRWIAGIHTVWAHNNPVVAKKYFPGNNEAQIRAEVLIYLIETHHITPEDCNKRLLEA
jgi:hypothetical protein